ncbi:MAG: hypothetical protein Q4G42_07210 [Neisseria sp.]|nr:hypothetical protein [Neisseria sp.]
MDYAAVLTVNIHGITDGGKPVEFTEKTIYDLLKNHDWLVTQITNEAQNEANFLPA